MSYSSDFRKCVLDFVKNGGSKAEASRRFGISRTIIYDWLAAQDPLTCKKPGPQGPRTLDYQALKQHVADFPDATQQERADHFGVSKHGIWYALKKLNKQRRKIVKTLVMFSIAVMFFTGCAIFTPQEAQEERRRLLALRDAARERHNPERVKQAVKDLLVGKWQYVGLEVEEGNVYANRTKSMPQQMMDSLSTTIDGLSKGVTGKQAETPNLPEQAETPNAPNAEPNQQTSEGNATRLPPIEVRDEKSNQRILGAKAALVASTRKNLILEFTEDRSSYYYSGSNRGTNVTGQCYVTTKRYGDDPHAFIRFNQRTGPELLEFLFGSEAIKQITAKQKLKRAEMTQNFNRKGALKATSRSISSMPGITVTDDTLSLVLYGDMQLTPRGWMRTGGLRCTFKRIE